MGGLSEKKANQDLLQNQQFIELMERVPCVVFIINHATSNYEFFSKNVRHIMGYTAEEMLQGGVEFGVSLVDISHRDNMAKYIIPALFQHFSGENNKNELKKLKISFNFKYRRKDGQTRWALHQMTIIETDERGGPMLNLVFMSDVTALKKDDLMDFSVAKLNDNGYYEPIFTKSFPDSSQTSITPREWEIIKLIQEGRTSLKIAEILHLSHHTVKTHRRNILEKLDAENTAEVLKICRRKGLL